MSRTSFRSTGTAASTAHAPRHGLARVLSKLGACSRSQAEQWIREGRVSLDGRVIRDPHHPTLLDGQQVAVDGHPVKSIEPVATHVPSGLAAMEEMVLVCSAAKLVRGVVPQLLTTADPEPDDTPHIRKTLSVPVLKSQLPSTDHSTVCAAPVIPVSVFKGAEMVHPETSVDPEPYTYTFADDTAIAM